MSIMITFEKQQQQEKTFTRKCRNVKIKTYLQKDFNPFWIIKQTNHENPEGR